MDQIEKLRLEYFIFFIVRLVTIIIITSAIVLCVLNKNSISFKNEVFNNLLFYGLIVIFGFTELLCVYDFFNYCKDFQAAKNSEFLELTGTVLKFAKNQNVDSGQQINSIPIIKIIDSDEIIELKVNGLTKIGQTYKFRYLKHTKMSVIISCEFVDKS